MQSLFEICCVLLFVNFIICDQSTTSKQALIPCYEDADCENVNGHCIRNFCQCNGSINDCKLQEHTLVNKIGEKCNTFNDCNIDFAVCTKSRMCSCGDGYVASEDKRKCLPTATSLDSSCEESVQCYTKIPLTGCHKNKCMCQQHMHEVNGSCYKNVDLGGSCQLIDECSLVAHAECRKSKCECMENYVPSGYTCLLKANGLNSSCTDDIQCQAQLNHGSECHDGVCRCQEMFHYKSSLNQCIYDKLLNEICLNHSDCHQPGFGPSRLICVESVCKCKPPLMEDNGYCLNSSTTVVLFKSAMLFLGTMFLVK